MIHLSLAEKSFGGARAPVLADLELALAPGEFVALLGPSGVGKTTVLRILAGLDTGFRGTLQSDTPQSDTPGLGYLFQEVRLMPWLTALENVALVVGGDRRRAASALAAVDLADAAPRFPHELSGGMQRRVALARAMACSPRLLLLDEPFVSLDRPATEELHELLLDYWSRERPTVVLVSHNLDEALALADRALFLGGQPARVVHELAIDLPRPRRERGAHVEQLRDALLAAHPRLLSGDAGQGSQRAGA